MRRAKRKLYHLKEKRLAILRGLLEDPLNFHKLSMLAFYDSIIAAQKRNMILDYRTITYENIIKK